MHGKPGTAAQQPRHQAIAERLALEQASTVISHEAIYRYIYHRSAQKDYWHRLPPRGKHRRGWLGQRGGSPVGHIQNRVSIAERPALAASRRQAGHWEADLLAFSRPGQSLLAAQERTSRFILMAKPASRQSAVIVARLARWFKALPENLRRTLTQDNGPEFAHHSKLNDRLSLETYFRAPPSLRWGDGGRWG